VSGLVLAYEPVWAIGTGRACDAAEANRVCGVVRATIREVFGESAAATLRVQYGGSVTEENAHELISQPEIDGGLVGGASLNPVKFAQIAQAASVIAKDMRYT
jgi:triosephosphate isomerase